ncbi:class I SAM-dependent rRNA methyltransferase [Lacicoccus alkaliphilus]|uniref:23S rRNA (Cytosine1962-C5)-methyltransferase n=1 Tax=Lacicoccus alkaliphilus DSM 16010 TaxID=1123231 RepID=A0A1M7CNX9_9BACL|nr:class I SAM-dependent rRNA methyltransferase [Salinicoccus alkaliphilus]SHL68964.1 23S rRNA (cytosine1962-C5)-methyltransferase [Salinicoccus alkaliphilus DSM 16010]
MNTIQLKKGAERPFHKGRLNIAEEDLSDAVFLKDGEVVELTDYLGAFIGYAMMSFEQRTHGWILSRDEDVQIDERFIREKIITAIEERTPLYNQEDTDVFRIFNEIGDGIGGLSIDDFNGHLLITYYSAGIYKIRNLVVQVLIETLTPESITEQTRFSIDGRMQIENTPVTGNAPERIIVTESGMRFNVNLTAGPMTGLFLDQRETRKALLKNKHSHNEAFLNLFAYSGSFSVAAALSGMSTTSVDMAGRTTALVTENFNVNDLPLDNHHIHIMDTFDYLKYAERQDHQFDTILIDPPSFSRNKKKVFKVGRDYPKLIREAVKILKPGGELILSQNLETFTLNQFKKQIDETMKHMGRGYTLQDVKGLPKDFRTTSGYRNGKYLKIVTIKLAND